MAGPTSLPSLDIDYRGGKVPDWVRDCIDTHLAIETEDAKTAGKLGFMARALVIATMPYKDPKADVFTRVNGDFRLRIVAGYEGGLPFGVYPRLLTAWVATEAVRTQAPTIELGDTLNAFLRVLDLSGGGGGPRGSSTRVAEQMRRLFGSLITAQYTGATGAGKGGRGSFILRNVLLAEELELHAEDEERLWTPQASHVAGQWRSHVRLSNGFYSELVNSPVPIDLRAYKALRGSPLAMDIYSWLTYRMSYTTRRTRPIRWEPLMGQFGTSFGGASGDLGQATRDFKKQFLRALKAVQIVYPEARFEVTETGLVLLPSPTSIPAGIQGSLF